MNHRCNIEWFAVLLYLMLLLPITVYAGSVAAQDSLYCDHTADVDTDNDGLIEICDLEALNAIRYQLDGSGYRTSATAEKITAGCADGGCNGYELVRDLDFMDSASYAIVSNRARWTVADYADSEDRGWHPIGTSSQPFNAIFEGKGHTLSNLMINRPTTDYVGLFAYVGSSATLVNLGLLSVHIEGNNDVGGLVGANFGGRITDSYAKGTVAARANLVGGLVGVNRGIIASSYATATVTGVNSSGGGLVGWNEGLITNSYATGAVIGIYVAEVMRWLGGELGGLVGFSTGRIRNSYATGAVTGDRHIGGLVGEGGRSYITNSYATGAVTGNKYIGGLVGTSRRGYITNSYAMGAVEGRLNDVGGLVGVNAGWITSSYATGVVSGKTNVGGLVGTDSEGNITHSYWDRQRSGIAVSASGTSKTTAELQLPTTATGIYRGWNIADWDFGNPSHYPRLKYAVGTDSRYPACGVSNQPTCGELVPDQLNLLAELAVAKATVFPPFASEIRNYDVVVAFDATQLELQATATGASLRILSDATAAEVLSADTVSAVIPLNLIDDEAIRIEVMDGVRRPIVYSLSVLYAMDEATAKPSAPIVVVDGALAIDEGATVALRIGNDYQCGADLRCEWHYRDAASQAIELANAELSADLLRVDFTVPLDYAGRQTTRQLSIVFAARNRGDLVKLETAFVVMRRDNGSIDAASIAPPTLSANIVIAPELDLVDDPDGVNAVPIIQYQWQRAKGGAVDLRDLSSWENIADATDMTYTLATTQFSPHRVQIRYTDAQGYETTLYSQLIRDIDADDDGLIEIRYIEELDAIRYQLNGTAYKASFAANNIAIGCPSRGCIGYELHNDLDFKDPTSYRDSANRNTWTRGLGWQPLGGRLSSFNAVFEGRGHAISNLFIDRLVDYVALFGRTSKAAKINGFVLSSADIKGRSFTGSLVGLNAGIITNVELRGGRIVGVGNRVGGLVGANEGMILNGNAIFERLVGGVVERRCREDVRTSDCRPAEKIEIVIGDGNHVGALVGHNEGQISDSFTMGDLLGRNRVGGLVGFNSGSIGASYARTNVTASHSYAGGLVGTNSSDAQISDSYATGTVDGYNNIGGLVGRNENSSINNSFAANRASGNDDVGGLVGHNVNGRIINTYARSSVKGEGNRIGGLIGHNEGTVVASFAAGQLSGDGDDVGGLIGRDYTSRVRNASAWTSRSYWDSEIAGVSLSDGGIPKTTEQLKSPIVPGAIGETFERWSVDDWDFGTADQYPMLKYTEGPNRGRIVPHAQTELSPELTGIELSDKLKLFPPFSARILNYRVKIDNELDRVKLTPTSRDATAAIRIVADSGVDLSSDAGSAATILLNDAPQPTLITVADRYQVRMIRPLASVSVRATKQNLKINEGERITLSVSALGAATDLLRYNWSQISPSQRSLLNTSERHQAELDLAVATDFVGRNTTHSSLVLRVTVSDGETTVVRDTTLTIVKINNGSLSDLSAPKLEDGTLVAADISLAELGTDPDGAGDIESIRYQWQYQVADTVWRDIDGANQHRYRVPLDTVPISTIVYRVQLSYIDKQAYAQSVVSAGRPIDATHRGGDFVNINYLEDLNAIRLALDGDYQLLRDLDFNDPASYRNPFNITRWTTNAYRSANGGWVPLGTSTIPFNGFLEGNGYAILNLQIDRADSSNQRLFPFNSSNQGLFAFIGEEGVISNLGLLNVKIDGDWYVGSFAGRNEGTIINSYAIAEISGQQIVGGLLAYSAGRIINSYAFGEVSGIQLAGGLVGTLSRFGRILNSYAELRVIVRESRDNDFQGRRGGGLVAESDGSIVNSYAAGSVTGRDSIGGLVGSNQSNGVISASYAISEVQSEGSDVGSLVGRNEGLVRNSYWNTDIEDARDDSGKGYSTQQLQAPTAAIGVYSDWDENDWDFGTNKHYPLPKHARLGDEEACNPPCGEPISPSIRYSLRNVEAAHGAVLSPAFDTKHSRTGIYLGNLNSTSSTIQLIPTTVEATARVRFYVDNDKEPHDSIASGAISKEIMLRDSGYTRILIEIDGTQRVRYKLYLRYRATDSDGAVLINYLEDLDAVRHQLEGDYRLAADLDFNDPAAYRDLSNKANWTVNDYTDSTDIGWMAIGSVDDDDCEHIRSNCFRGKFDGNGYTISNLQINQDNVANQALFAGIHPDALVSDVGLSALKVEGGRSSGGLAGVNDGRIERSHAVGRVQYVGRGPGTKDVGGLVGYNRGGTVANSYFVGEVLGATGVGGLVGSNGARIINSYANAVVSGSSTVGGLVGVSLGSRALIVHSYALGRVSGEFYVGGLTGWSEMGRITTSYAANRVVGRHTAGGLIGWNDGAVDASYATGRVSGQIWTGGLIGYNRMGGSVTHTYSIGSVPVVEEQGTTVKGLIGSNANPSSVSASYWNINTSGRRDSAGGHAKTTRQLQSGVAQRTTSTKAYYNWSTDVWDFGTDAHYPTLKYTEFSNIKACEAAKVPKCGDLISPWPRYGLRNLAPAGAALLSPPFSLSEQNQSGAYFGELIHSRPTIALIPTAMEATASMSIYLGTDETLIEDDIESGTASNEIELNPDGLNRIIIAVKGTRTVRYALFLRYSGKDNDGDGLIDIDCLEDLDAIRYHSSSRGYELLRNLDFEDDASYCDPSNKDKWTVDDYLDYSDVGWRPIDHFSGTFYGNGYTISNLQINKDAVDNQGLFAFLAATAVVRDLGLLKMKIEGGANSGGIAATNRGTLSASYALGEISATRTVGGLVGLNNGALINSYAYATLSAVADAGVLVGENQALIANSHAAGNASGIDNIGGLVGLNSGGRIINSYASSDVEGESAVGGLVARLSGGSLRNGNATGRVVGNRQLGGLVGAQVGDIVTSYSIAKVMGSGSGAMDLGGLVGLSGGTITASYWDTQTSIAQGSNGRGQTTRQLQSPTAATGIYARWHNNNWDFGTARHYPLLKYAKVSAYETCGTADLAQCGDLISPGLRYGLSDLRIAGSAILSPPFTVAIQNQIGTYIGTVVGDSHAVRLIPTAMEPSARIRIRVGEQEHTLRSGGTSRQIPLKDDATTRVIVDVEGTQTIRYTLYLDYAYGSAIADAEGFVEINYLEDLNAIRYQLDGSGYRANAAADKIVIGCPSEQCKGYKLMRDLDFNAADSYRDAEAHKSRWTGSGSWVPIASGAEAFSSIFKGNNKTLSGLKVRGNGGLFAALGSTQSIAHVDGVGLLGVDIKGSRVGGITTECTRCTISNSYVIGTLEGIESAGGLLATVSAVEVGDTRLANSYFAGDLSVTGRDAVGGGLIAETHSDVVLSNSYAIAKVRGNADSRFVGGLIATRHFGEVEIINSYAAVMATKGSARYGLFGGNADPDSLIAPTIIKTYLDTDIAGIAVTVGGDLGTEELQTPTTATGIYSTWSVADWDFGTAYQYPAVKYTIASHNDAEEGCDTKPENSALCGTLLRHQGSLLKNLELTGKIGLSEAFAYAKFNYALAISADQSAIQLIPTAFSPHATIEAFIDGELITRTASGALSAPIPLQERGNTVIELVVNDGGRRSYRYALDVNRLDFATENIDKDGDGLIDIRDVAHFNAIRYDLDGVAYREGDAEPIYCSNNCVGYELTADLDLSAVDWRPIGTRTDPFNGVFNGNGHTISNLTLDASDSDYVGLFGASSAAARIENIGLVNVDIKGGDYTGGLVGANNGKLINCFVTGKIAGQNFVGGLVGSDTGSVIASYANVRLEAADVGGGLLGYGGGQIRSAYAHGVVESDSGSIGGLIAHHGPATRISTSYASADVIANGAAGGLTFTSGAEIITSYYKTGGVVNGMHSGGGTSRTEMMLKAGVPSDEIYTEWDEAHWYFANAHHYPALLYTVGDVGRPACRRPSAQEVSACDAWLPSGLSTRDRTVLCHSHLRTSHRDLPYCGALLPEQRRGLIQLDFSADASLLSPFDPAIYGLRHS